MSITDYSVPACQLACGAAQRPRAARALHRLRRVRRREGVSRRTMARRLKSNVSLIKSQEKETSDIRLSTLYQWQDVLKVPIGELLVEARDGLSPAVMKRAQMVRLMKTGMAILERTQQPDIRRMAQMLVEQLIELMPELSEVKAWPAVGKRRARNELGQAVGRSLSRDALANLADGD